MSDQTFPPVFVISLVDSPRRAFIADRLNAMGIKFEFFDAVYGKTLPQEILEKVDYDYYVKELKSKKKLTLGEIGCAMSHIGVYEKIVRENIPQAIILEDDAVVSLRFIPIVETALRKLPPSADILFLDHGKAKVTPWWRSLPERYRLQRYLTPSKNSLRGIWGTPAYMITQSGCKKLLANAYPIRMPSDALTGFPQKWGTKCWGIEPPCSFSSPFAQSEIESQGSRYDED